MGAIGLLTLSKGRLTCGNRQTTPNDNVVYNSPRHDEGEAFSFDGFRWEIVVVLDNNGVVSIGNNLSVESDLNHGCYCCGMWVFKGRKVA